MRLREETELPADAIRELDALDAALAGEPVAADLVDLVDLALALRDERPRPADSFTRGLDTRAAAAFRGDSAASTRQRVLAAWGGRLWMPALGAAASVAVATVLALSVAGTEQGPSDQASSGPTTTTAVPGVASTGSARGQAAPGTGSGQVLDSVQPGFAQDESTANTLRDATAQDDAASPTSPNTASGGASGAPDAELSRESKSLGSLPPVPAPITGDPINRNVERGANLRLATTPKRLDEVSGRVVRVTDGVGGFVRSSSVDSRSGLGGGATFELQIPVTRLQTALARLSQLASVRSRTESSLDVTEQVTFARNRVVALRAERRSLLRQLEAAPSLDETARLRARLRSIEARLDSAQSVRAQLRQRTTYSPVFVQIVTERPRSGADAGPWTPRDALDDAGRVLEIAAGVALIALAVLMPLALIAAVAWPLVRVARRRRREQALDATAGATSPT